ncbi:MAG: GerW family sporulation protein [Oscillospiraceae bacterium]|nr:GerW family sporulation protein [Oscillospiraceae bacterium]
MAHPIEGMLGTSMDRLREVIDVNIIIGEAVEVSGTTIIPVSKVSFGFASGGSNIASKSEKDLFGGGVGTGVTMQPIAFLVITDGDVKLLQLGEPPASTADRVVSAVPELLEKLGGLFKKDKEKE